MDPVRDAVRTLLRTHGPLPPVVAGGDPPGEPGVRLERAGTDTVHVLGDGDDGARLIGVIRHEETTS